MSRLIFIFIFLIFLDIGAYTILTKVSDQRKSFPVDIDKHAFIYEKKDLKLDPDGDFNFDEFFGILSADKQNCHYSMNENTICVELNGKSFQYPYSFREKEVIEHETVIIKEVPVYIPVNSEQPQVVSSPKNEQSENQKEIYADQNDNRPVSQLKVSRSSYSYPEHTDLTEIVSAIKAAIICDETVTIDYSMLNPDVKGSYPVMLISDYETLSVTVEIF